MYHKSWERLLTFFSPKTSFRANKFRTVTPQKTLNGNDSYLIERGDKVKAQRAKQYGIHLHGSHTHSWVGTEFMKITSDNGEIESTIFMAQFNDGYYLSLPYQTAFQKSGTNRCLPGGVKCDAEIFQWTSHFLLLLLFCVSITFPTCLFPLAGWWWADSKS